MKDYQSILDEIVKGNKRLNKNSIIPIYYTAEKRKTMEKIDLDLVDTYLKVKKLLGRRPRITIISSDGKESYLNNDVIIGIATGIWMMDMPAFCSCAIAEKAFDNLGVVYLINYRTKPQEDPIYPRTINREETNTFCYIDNKNRYHEKDISVFWRFDFLNFLYYFDTDTMTVDFSKCPPRPSRTYLEEGNRVFSNVVNNSILFKNCLKGLIRYIVDNFDCSELKSSEMQNIVDHLNDEINGNIDKGIKNTKRNIDTCIRKQLEIIKKKRR